MIQGDDVYINGDGETSRDFCYIENTVQANLLAATAGLMLVIKFTILLLAGGRV